MTLRIRRLVCGLLTIASAAVSTAILRAQAPTGVVTGIVVDARTRQPLAGALVELRDAGPPVVADSAGRFRFTGIVHGPYELIVSLVGYAFSKQDIVVGQAEVTLTIALSEGAADYAESVTVQGDAFGARESGVAGQQSIGSADLRQLGGLTLDDPVRAVQALAGVTASDDFYSELAVRGQPFPRLNYTLDGVPANFLVHTIERIEDGGSITMINSDILDRVSLLRGARPQRFGSRLGAQLDFLTREGSRQRQRYNLTASGTSASLTAEGPLGKAKRGSWLVSGRRSYLDLFLKQVLDDSSTAFGFSDAFSRVVYDVSERHQVQASVLYGRSHLGNTPEPDEQDDLEDATHRGWLASAAWRHTITPAISLTHRVFVLGDSFDNHNGLDVEVATGRSWDRGYRADLAYAAGGGRLFEAGFSVQRTGEQRRQDFEVPGWHILGGEDYDAQATQTGGFGQMRWTAGRFTFTPGVRVDRSGLIDEWTTSPWFQTEWQATPDVTIVAGAGLQHQFPNFAQVVGRRGSATLDPERALHVDLGVEGRLSADTRWQVTVFDREERDVLDLPGQYDRLVGDDVLVPRSATSAYENRLRGWSRGVEVMLQRKSPDALSGWIAYSYGHTRYTDTISAEEFDGDFDQRHTLAVFGRYRISDRSSVNARIRYGSNRPIVGYIDRAAGEFFVGRDRNTARVPAYVRVDLRADRTYRWGGRRVTLFGEVMNVLNRDNQRQTPPTFVDPRTRRIGFPLDSMFPIVPSIGLTIEF